MKRFTDRDLALLRNRMGENIPVPKEREKPTHEESRIQCEVIQWWASACKIFGVPEILLFAIANAGKRGVILGRIMKREGLRAGVSDLFLSVPRGQFHGLYIEMKKPNGVVSPSQQRFQCIVTSQEYAAYVCYSAAQARKLIAVYLMNPVAVGSFRNS
jgi:hypothetical protein